MSVESERKTKQLITRNQELDCVYNFHIWLSGQNINFSTSQINQHVRYEIWE